MDKKINDFIVFCIEIFKEKKQMTGKEAHELFEKYDVFQYLENGYDILHTQGDKWIVEDIEEFIRIRE